MTLTPNSKNRPETYRKYTKEDKERYALAWILHGEVVRAASACGIPRKTCETWMLKSWWPALVEVVRIRHKDQIEAKYERILDKSTDALIDRIEGGDTVIIKGKEKRVPVKAKELASIIDITQANLRTSRDQPNNISVTATMDLRKLAANFARAGRIYQYNLHGLEEPNKGLPLLDTPPTQGTEELIEDADYVSDEEESEIEYEWSADDSTGETPDSTN